MSSMSGSWGRQLGTLIGGSLAGPCGAIIGAVGGTVLGKTIAIDDPIRDAIGGVIGEQAGALLGQLSPAEVKRVNHDLQKAFRDAFCEALYDIGGEACFADVWKASGGRDVPREVIYPRSSGHYLWQRKNPLAGQIGEFLHQLVTAVFDMALLPLEASQPMANVMTYLAARTPQGLADQFFRDLLVPYLSQSEMLFREVPSFGPHLRRYLLDRTILHLGEHLKQRSETWRAFNRWMLEGLQDGIKQLASGQTEIVKRAEQLVGGQEQLRLKLEQVETRIEYFLSSELSAFSDILRELLTKTGGIERRFDEGFEALMGRVLSQHTEVLVKLDKLEERFALLSQELLLMVRDELSVTTTRTAVMLFPPPPRTRQFVSRPAEFERLVELLLADQSPCGVYALSGGAGFGKTTLAQAVCDENRVKEAFADGILWVTVGREPNLLELLTALAKSLDPQAAAYSDLNLAANQFRSLLANREVLVVLDDVWSESDVKPFIALAAPLLITTRLQNVEAWQLQSEVVVVTVGSMSTQQARSLLINWLSGTEAAKSLNFPDLIEQLDELTPKARQNRNCSDLIELLEVPEAKVAESLECCRLYEQLDELAQKLGAWPLLLELVGAQLRDYVTRRRQKLSVAIVSIEKRLDARGFGVFDRTKKGERNRAISISFELSLEQLDECCEEFLNERSSWRQRFLELAFFALDVNMPFEMIFKLWNKTATFDQWGSQEALFAMQSLSLFTHVNPETQTVRLHNVVHALIAAKQKEQPIPHEQLVHELLRSCFSFEWLEQKLSDESNINALLANYQWLPKDESLKRMGQALGNAAHILSDEPAYLAGQLIARLLADEREPIPSLVASARQALRPPGLLPLRASLEEREAFQRTFSDHLSGIKGVAIEGGFAISASSDKTLKVWDVERGQELRTLKGHQNRVAAVVLYEGKVISGAWDGEIKVWDLMSGEALRTLSGHSQAVTALALLDSYLLSASEDQTVKVWNIEDGKLLRTLAHDEEVTAVAAHRRRVISADGEGRLMVWDMVSGEQLASWQAHDDWVTGLAAADRWVVSASHDECLKVWDIVDGKEVALLRGHSDWVTGVAMKEQIVLSVSQDRELRVWDWGTGNCLTSFNFDEPLAACAYGEANTIVAGGESGRLHFLRLLPAGF